MSLLGKLVCEAQCWPILSAGHDLIGIAKSGSGKTLAWPPQIEMGFLDSGNIGSNVSKARVSVKSKSKQHS